MSSLNESLMKDAQPMVQRRRFPRSNVEAAVAVCSVVSKAAQIWRGHCLNLSEGGAGVIVGGPWLPGQVVNVEFVPMNGNAAKQMVARVAHRTRLYCGLEFLGKSDSSFSELKTVLAS